MFVNIKSSLDVLKIVQAKLFCISTFTYGLLGLYKKNFNSPSDDYKMKKLLN